MTQLLAVLLVCVSTGGAYGDGAYWWMNSGAFAGNNVPNANQNKQQNSGASSGSKGNYYQTNQNTGVNQQTNQNTGVNPGNNFQGSQDDGETTPSSSECAHGLSCLPPSSCSVSADGDIQARVSNFVECGNSNVCCAPALQDEESDSGQVEADNNLVEVDPNLLPITECPAGMSCVSQNYCNNYTEISETFIPLSDQDLINRKLIPCMNVATGILDVCCNQVPSPIDNSADTQTADTQSADSQTADPQSADSQTADPQSAVPIITENIAGLGNVLPATQGLSNNQNQGSCPAITNIPPVDQCAGAVSNCWSVGQPDVDCTNNGLCCFDGCANVCLGEDSVSPVLPPNPRQPVQQPSIPVQQASKNVPKVQQPVQQQPKVQQPVQQQPKVQQPVQQQPNVQQPRPAQQQPNVPQQQPKVPQQQPKVPQQQPKVPQQQFNNVQQQANFIPADQRPFVTCPSAMKCVLRENCDFDGVMVNEIINRTPELDALTVPLIPCVNRMRGNSIDVCCRDPNYQDPWPNMDGNNNVNTGFNNNNVNSNSNTVDNFEDRASNSATINSPPVNSPPKKNGARPSYGR